MAIEKYPVLVNFDTTKTIHFMPKINLQRSITINKPADQIYTKLNNFHYWQAWSPWLIMEPEAKVDVAEDGKSYSWEGHRVGSGNMKVLHEDENKSISYDLNFLTPWKSTAKTEFELKSNGDSTEVIWIMDSSLPFFMFWMKKMMIAFISMDYDRGLALLKDYVEDGVTHSKLDFKGESSYDGCNYIGYRNSCPIMSLGESMSNDFTKLERYFADHQDNVQGPPMTVYHKWDMVKGQVDYTSGFPVHEKPSDLPPDITSGSVPATKVYSLVHTGPYAHLGNAWSTLYTMQRNKEFKLNKQVDPFEVYVNSPKEVSSNELVTVINFPIK